MSRLSRERFIVVMWSAMVLILAFLPYIMGWSLSNDQKVFTHVIDPFYQDKNAYFSWIKQAEQGKLLGSILNTPEYSRPLFFHPVFFVIGWLAGLSKISTIILFYAAIFAADILLLFSLYRFLNQIIRRPLLRVISFSAITFAGGLGWVIPSVVDVAYPEVTFNQILSWPIILALALGLILLGYTAFLRYVEKPHGKHLFYFGLFGLLLSFVHPYDLPLYYAPILFYVLGLLIFKRLSFGELLRWPILWGALPLLGVGYYLFLISSDWVFAYNFATLSLTSAPFLSYLEGLFPLSLFSLAGIGLNIRSRSLKHLGFIIIWPAVSLGLAFTPIPIQRRLILGITVPLGILAAVLFVYIWDKIKLQNVYVKILWMFYLIIGFMWLSATTFDLVIFHAQQPLSREFPFYLSNGEYKALNWLDQNSDDSSVILSTSDMGSFISRYTGRRTFAAHWAQTINFSQKSDVARSFFDCNMTEHAAKKLLADNFITHVYFGTREQLISDFSCSSKYGLELVYSDSNVEIYKNLWLSQK